MDGEKVRARGGRGESERERAPRTRLEAHLGARRARRSLAPSIQPGPRGFSGRQLPGGRGRLRFRLLARRIRARGEEHSVLLLQRVGVQPRRVLAIQDDRVSDEVGRWPAGQAGRTADGERGERQAHLPQ